MRSILLSSALGVLLASCGGGSGGGTSGGSASGDFLIRDAPTDELLSFSARVRELRLVAPNGGMSANLLQGPVTMELMGLHSRMFWLARANFPAGTWSSMRIWIDPASIQARNMSGSLVPVHVSNSVLTARMSSSVTLGASGYGRWVADLDLAGSLTGSVSSPPLDFDAHGTAFCDGGNSGMHVEYLRGLVQSVDAASSTLFMTAWVDDRCSISVGPVRVSVPPDAQVIDRNGMILTGPAFFPALQSGLTFLEVRGLHTFSGIQAQRIQIEDQQGGSGTQDEVEIDGKIASVGPGSTFSLLIQNFERGAWIADPVLASLGDPASVAIGYDGSTLFVSADSGAGNPGMLEVGERVEVKIPVFDNPPFHASRVVIETTPEFEGTIVSTAGLPSSMMIRLLPGSLAITSGQVSSDTTNVTVLLQGSSWYLDVGMGMGMQANQLLTGLRIQCHGVLSGPPTGPTIDAVQAECWVHPGRCRGTVTSTMMGDSTFDCSDPYVFEPFGGGADQGPFTVHFAQSCMFYGDASSQSDFFERCGGMHGGQHMQVDIYGLGTGWAGQIQAYGLVSQVQ